MNPGGGANAGMALLEGATIKQLDKTKWTGVG